MRKWCAHKPRRWTCPGDDRAGAVKVVEASEYDALASRLAEAERLLDKAKNRRKK